MKNIFLLLICFVLIGCTTTNQPNMSPGSKHWHHQRIQEIEDSYANGEITKKEYLSLKNETDLIRQERLKRDDIYLRRTSFSFHDPYYNHHYHRH